MTEWTRIKEGVQGMKKQRWYKIWSKKEKKEGSKPKLKMEDMHWFKGCNMQEELRRFTNVESDILVEAMDNSEKLLELSEFLENLRYAVKPMAIYLPHKPDMDKDWKDVCKQVDLALKAREDYTVAVSDAVS